jgi:cytochrome P450
LPAAAASYILPQTEENMPNPAPTPVRVPLVTQPLGIFASLAAARRNILSIIPDIATRQPMVSGKTGKRWHMVMDPEALKRVLLEKLDDYPKSDVTKNLLRPAIGESLFVAEGAHWRWQRRAAAPVFSHRNVTNLGPIMSAAAQNAASRITQAMPRALNMYDEMVRATFEVISDVTFSGDQGFDRAAVHRAIDQYIAEAGRVSLLDMIGAPVWFPRPGRLFAGRAVKQMKSMADQAIESRKAAPPSDIPDLLDLLLAGEDPDTKRAMNTAELRDNLLAFIVAGHETTALTLSWALYLCAFDPTVQARARSEAQSVLSGRTATAQDVPNLPVTRMIIDEALRLYPPAALVSRTALKHDTLGGRDIRPGDTVILPIYALHRSHQLWPQPDQFNPDRFANRKQIQRFTYLPFGDGPRICIGASFATQEAVIILATLLARFRFTPVPGKQPDPVMILTLRPQGGVWLQAENV